MMEKGKSRRKESLFNALIHQDFSAAIPIQISVYRDRLYISNDCVFPENWTSETLFQKHRSLPHNPDIANTFFRAGFIESWGRGVEKICNLCKNYEIPDPVYIVHPCDIMIMFKAKAVENRSNAGRLQEDFRKTSERLQKNVPEFARKTFDFIKENPKITIAELASKLGLSERSVLSHIALLKSGGWIERVGGKTYGHWKIIRNN